MNDTILIDKLIFDSNVEVPQLLIDSIEKMGLVTPILVTPRGDKYLVVNGRHRARACKQLGMREVDCAIVTMTDEEVGEYRKL